MNPGDICICGHTREVHFEHDCSAMNCVCRQFAELGCALDLFTTLKQIAALAIEWDANQLGDKDAQRKRWKRMGHMAYQAIYRAKQS